MLNFGERIYMKYFMINGSVKQPDFCEMSLERLLLECGNFFENIKKIVFCENN